MEIYASGIRSMEKFAAENSSNVKHDGVVLLAFEFLQSHERSGEVTGNDPVVEIEIMRLKIEN